MAASLRPYAVIAGAGPGTGAAIARKFASSYSVFLLSRKEATAAPLAEEINKSGGQATAIAADVSDASSVKAAFEKIAAKANGGVCAAAVYNVGAGLNLKSFLEYNAEEFTNSFNASALGGFNFAQAVLPALLSTAKGTALNAPASPSLIYTGATASLRASPKWAPFAAGKWGLRALTQSLAKEFGPQGVHVSHVIIDGVIDIEKTKAWNIADGAPDAKLSPDAIAEEYWHLHNQHRSAWSWEADLRPYLEKW